MALLTLFCFVLVGGEAGVKKRSGGSGEGVLGWICYIAQAKGGGLDMTTLCSLSFLLGRKDDMEEEEEENRSMRLFHYFADDVKIFTPKKNRIER
nr:hypothetical protein CFP56_62777 [Quercus suber]